MNKQILDEQLQKFGLSEDEASLYLFLLENGPKTPLEISRESELNRSKIYRLTEVLQAKGLVEESKTAWGQKLQAAPPDHLRLLIQKEEEHLAIKKETLPSLLDALSSLPGKSGTDFEIKHYKGTEGLKQMLWNELTAKEVVFFGYKSINDFVGKKFADKQKMETFQRKMKYYGIHNDEFPKRPEEKIWDPVFDFRRIDNKVLEIKQFINIYNDTVSIINPFEEAYVGLEIINKNFADTMKQVFWNYWVQAEQYYYSH